MARTKAKVRSLPTFIPAPDQRIGNKTIRWPRSATFKIKIFLPQAKVAEVKKFAKL